MSVDLPVFELAQSELDNCVNRVFASNQELETALLDFNDRCSRRYHNFRPLLNKGEPLPDDRDIADDKSTNRPEHLKPANRNS